MIKCNLGLQLSVWIMQVSLISSVHINRFHCIYIHIEFGKIGFPPQCLLFIYIRQNLSCISLSHFSLLGKNDP